MLLRFLHPWVTFRRPKPSGFGWIVPARVAILAALMSGLFAGSVSATTLHLLDAGELTRGSHRIVIGQVEKVVSRWNANRTGIFTDVTVRVAETIKGDSTAHITLTQMGGEVDGMRVTVPGSPTFARGQQTLLFVWRDGRGGSQVTGLGQGKFDIMRDLRTGRRLIQRRTPGLAVRDARLRHLVAPGKVAPAIELEDLMVEVRRALAEEQR